MRFFLTTLAFVVLAGAPGFVRAQDKPAMDMNHMNMRADSKTPADKAFDEAMKTMMKDMVAAPTGNPDKDFVVMMMPHHQGAIDMAKVELRYGRDPMLRKLAADIVKAQETEIAEMKAWLAKHGT